MSRPDFRTAIHEAGHAVLVWHHGESSSLIVWPDAETRATCRYQGAFSPGADVEISMAGLAAEDVFFGDVGGWARKPGEQPTEAELDANFEIESGARTDIESVVRRGNFTYRVRGKKMRLSLQDRFTYAIGAFAFARRIVEKNRGAVEAIAKAFMLADLDETAVASLAAAKAPTGGAS